MRDWEQKMKAVIYARFSSEKQNEASIEGQLRECSEYAKYNGIKIVGQYIDRAMSAKTDQRPEFQQMIRDSYKKNFDAVIVWKLDRFSRDRIDSANYKFVLKRNGVRVISAKENISEGADGILLESLLEGYAEYYSAELAEKVKRGMTENALKAKANGVRPPFGYYVDKDEHYKIDEELAPIVREMFTLYLDGMRVKDIARLMNTRGIKNRGFDMQYNTVFRILTNRKYIGEYKFGNVVLPNGMPAIIDADTFEQVQARMKNNKKAPAMHRSEDDYILTTKLFCGKCGAMMTGCVGTGRKNTKYRYYICNNARKHQCGKKTVKKDWIEDLVIKEVLALISSDAVINELADRVYDLQAAENTSVLIARNKLAEVKKKLRNLAEAIANGLYSSTTKELLNELEEQKSNLENELSEMQKARPFLSKEEILFILYSYLSSLNRASLINEYLFPPHFITVSS